MPSLAGVLHPLPAVSGIQIDATCESDSLQMITSLVRALVGDVARASRTQAVYHGFTFRAQQLPPTLFLTTLIINKNQTRIERTRLVPFCVHPTFGTVDMAQQIELRQVKGGHDREDLFNTLNEYLQPQSSTTASSVASAVANLPVDKNDITRTWDEGFFWGFWSDVISVAEQIPHNHPAQDKLVAFLKELSSLPDTGVKVWDARVWADLPLMGAAFREHLNGSRVSGDAETQAEMDRAWVSFHAFEARVINAGLSQSETFAIWMLRAGLEEDQANSKTFDRDLMTAAVYIEYAGPTLLDRLAKSPEPRLGEQDQRMLKGGSLFSGKSGLTRERWMFWIDRFRELAEKTTDGEVKQLALHAADLIEEGSKQRLQG
ncbi:Uu.00g074770.m01.CDS01 [Anthostomella pinea]|uniref:Uu.00g074770.m01.CDS01 n=1 Tax=Anthostomella pinea TaxID=933095 RepID=A0AAI8YLP0_9PEZI|nr:Uu.00g074770.m01.CDS01 [Anthostomella pinea]